MPFSLRSSRCNGSRRFDAIAAHTCRHSDAVALCATNRRTAHVARRCAIGTSCVARDRRAIGRCTHCECHPDPWRLNPLLSCAASCRRAHRDHPAVAQRTPREPQLFDVHGLRETLRQPKAKRPKLVRSCTAALWRRNAVGGAAAARAQAKRRRRRRRRRRRWRPVFDAEHLVGATTRNCGAARHGRTAQCAQFSSRVVTVSTAGPGPRSCR